MNNSLIEESFNESLSNKVAKHLLKKILSRELKPGDRIVETNVANELGISHAPVREALYLLQVDGVVERLPRKGVRVRDFSLKEINDYIETLMFLLSITIDSLQEKWTAENSKQLKNLLDEAELASKSDDVIKYIPSTANVLRYLFVVANNTANMKFFKDIIFVTNIASEAFWETVDIKTYQASLKKGVEYLLNNKFEEAKQQFIDTFSYGREALKKNGVHREEN